MSDASLIVGFKTCQLVDFDPKQAQVTRMNDSILCGADATAVTAWLLQCSCNLEVGGPELTRARSPST